MIVVMVVGDGASASDGDSDGDCAFGLIVTRDTK